MVKIRLEHSFEMIATFSPVPVGLGHSTVVCDLTEVMAKRSGCRWGGGKLVLLYLLFDLPWFLVPSYVSFHLNMGLPLGRFPSIFISSTALINV